ncbi:hypothetical protein [Ottowia thiooxydans]|uniref:hypothetical protein n=1 Tax=Ottowia thiooxydans TaxID=219182 RepID=UPI00040B6E9D|nr:hypothetical protein [Ottowia thiooxydans]
MSFVTISALSRRRTLLASTAVLAGALVAGCAGFSPKTPEEEVRARAEARWDSLVKRDFDKAYSYAQPGFRAVVTPEAYKQRFGSAGSWKGAQIHEATCEAARCTVRVRLTTAINIPRFSQTIPEVVGYHSEVWVRDGGQWWFFEKL